MESQSLVGELLRVPDSRSRSRYILQFWEHQWRFDAILEYDAYVDETTREVVDIMADLRTTLSSSPNIRSTMVGQSPSSSTVGASTRRWSSQRSRQPIFRSMVTRDSSTTSNLNSASLNEFDIQNSATSGFLILGIGIRSPMKSFR